MNRSSHIIEKVFFEVNTSKLEIAHSIKNNISEFLKNELFPRLELLFEEYKQQETIVRFDGININLSLDNWKDFNGFKYEIGKQLEDKISIQIKSDLEKLKFKPINSEADKPDIQKISFTKNYEATFLHFLENGCLPWFGKEEHIYEFSTPDNWNKSLENPVFVDKLKELFGAKNEAVARFINQFENELLVAFLLKINSKLKGNTAQILDLLGKAGFKIKYLFLKLLIKISVSGNINSIENSLQVFFHEIVQLKIAFVDKTEFNNSIGIVKFLQKIIPETMVGSSRFFEIIKKLNVENSSGKELISSLSEMEKLLNTETLLDEPELAQKEKELLFLEKGSYEIAVQNAGLILLHPFFKSFFFEIGIVDKQGDFVKEKLDLAVQSLHFIATGNENVFEGNLVFEKFLCGVPLKMPIQKESLLTDVIKAEVAVLMKEVIKHWPALKNSSPNDLRQMFIQRDGKIIQKEDKYKLIVERKAQDVLLEKLSWNISMVKLPWKKELLIVEW
ncbi:MAG: hypothetical protein L3J11_12015 [Draconibacterium sp.]|nr:hypothetical protein [Draconibacterium sp.]